VICAIGCAGPLCLGRVCWYCRRRVGHVCCLRLAILAGLTGTSLVAADVTRSCGRRPPVTHCVVMACGLEPPATYWGPNVLPPKQPAANGAAVAW
jgi:hypothetical protein